MRFEDYVQALERQYGAQAEQARAAVLQPGVDPVLLWLQAHYAQQAPAAAAGPWVWVNHEACWMRCDPAGTILAMVCVEPGAKRVRYLASVSSPGSFAKGKQFRTASSALAWCDEQRQWPHHVADEQLQLGKDYIKRQATGWPKARA